MSFTDSLSPSRDSSTAASYYHEAALGRVISLFTYDMSHMNRHKAKRRDRTKIGLSFEALGSLTAYIAIVRLPPR